MTNGSGIDVTSDGPVATLWLDRPDKRNAVTLEMWMSISRVCAELSAEPAVRVLVVRGRGEHFCAGADISQLDGGPGAGSGAYADANRHAEDALARFPKPTIALVTGSCVGGGCGIAIDCDLRIADTTARFGITPARLGIVYPAFSLERVVRLLGPSAAKHLLYTADLIDAERALRIGLVDELLAHGDAEQRVAELADHIASRSALTQQATKQMVAAVVDHGEVPAALAAHWQREVVAGADAAEGIAAFAERRDPRFTWCAPVASPDVGADHR